MRGAHTLSRNAGDHGIKSGARTAAPCIRIRLRTGRKGVFLSRVEARSKLSGRYRLCRHERISRGSRSYGRGKGHETHFAARASFFRFDRGRRSLYSRKRLSGGRRCDQCRNAVFIRHARTENILRRGGVRHSHFAGLVALSARFPRQSFERQKEICRKGSSVPCGVCAFPRRAVGNRQLFLSRLRNRGTLFFSFLRSSRLPFQAVPRENTFPPPEGKGSPWRSSQDRA